MISAARARSACWPSTTTGTTSASPPRSRTPWPRQAANINEGKGEWFRRECRKHGATVLLGTMVCGATVKGGRITGVVVVTPDGQRGVILAKVVIDATGNADVAAAVGEPTEFITPEEFSLQGASMNAGELGANTCNTEMGFVNDADAWDVSFFPLRMRNTVGWKWMWDQAQIVGSRERRHIVGAYTVTPIDVLAGRTFPDTDHAVPFPPSTRTGSRPRVCCGSTASMSRTSTPTFPTARSCRRRPTGCTSSVWA